MKYNAPQLDIEKYKEELDKKAEGLAKIYKIIKMKLNVKAFDFLKHANHATSTFLHENNLSMDYRSQARKYIIQKAREVKKEEELKRQHLKQDSLFKEKGLEGKL